MVLSRITLDAAGFTVGWASPWFAAVLGIVSGIMIGQLAERYTSYDYSPTKRISEASRQGYALNITQGLAIGMKSVFAPITVLAVAVIAANAVAGLYGVAMAAIGMLSFVAATVSVDTYGPIADNAGGISEMSKLDPRVREITDTLDSVGNTTAAIGKGFAIGSASLAALSLFASYLYSQADPGQTSGYLLNLDMINTLTLAGGLVGAALPFLFSGILIEAVAKAARKMVEEVVASFARISHPDRGIAPRLSTVHRNIVGGKHRRDENARFNRRFNPGGEWVCLWGGVRRGTVNRHNPIGDHAGALYRQLRWGVG